jgi:hypothetical protein
MEFRRSLLVARGSEGKNKKCGADPRLYATGVQEAGKPQAATACLSSLISFPFVFKRRAFFAIFANFLPFFAFF